MKLIVHLLFLASLAITAAAQAPAPAGAPEAAAGPDVTTQAAAAVAAGQSPAPQTPDFLEHLVDLILQAFDIRSSENTVTHYAIALLITLIAYVLRKVVTTFIFGFFKRLASRTTTTLDDKLFPALEGPVKASIVVVGTMLSLKVLKLSPTADQTLGYTYTAAFSLVLFWGFLRAFDTVLDHLQEVAHEKHLGLAPFMPWIKKSLLTIVFVFGVLMIAQSLGADVKAFLAGLGIGGLAFALAAQDTIANLFGSVVVAIDQPFKIGETIRIAGSIGTVEDIGLRSTKLRLVDRSLMIIPNKTVAAEAITNLSRFTARRVEQVFGLTYDATPAQLEAITAEIRRMIEAEPEVNAPDTHVYFRDFSASSLDLWVVYVTKDPDFAKHMALRQRLNLAIMRAIQARGLAFAYPTQTVYSVAAPEKKG
ncbi:Low conductance mechanosensitive channel YnaI [Lacunisphaera limnophila]|uniref:Low conductance mechanosensitive channel YnaI n=1 Tax=Lacunisphaera limnophila TaxID=1838286 RepID=A0A1D8AU91_9BACT|nr:mechanosensitive ion channel family protein [Lacunisphaera limnophila]AOS44447.1 Low conductance mechanosensitive channel YnaI [Lacunisphaera limnophila]